MVIIVDGFEEAERTRKEGELIAKLASSIFWEKKVSFPPYDKKVSVHGEQGMAVDIICRTRTISVARKQDYQNCLRLAEECEKALGEDFTLRTEYKNSR